LLNNQDSSKVFQPEFVNIREHCAGIHGDNAAGATGKAIEIIAAGVARAREAEPSIHDRIAIEKGVLILGAGLAGITAARDMTRLGHSVALVSGPDNESIHEKIPPSDVSQSIMKELESAGIIVNSWPEQIEVTVAPGSYYFKFRHGTQTSQIKAGAVIVNYGTNTGEISRSASAAFKNSVFQRMAGLNGSMSGITAENQPTYIRDFTTAETAGIFPLRIDEDDVEEEQMIKGSAAAGRASAFLMKGTVQPRQSAVAIEQQLCRGCGDCAEICPFIELVQRSDGSFYADINAALCTGCGACMALCPTGAISQYSQTNEHIIASLGALLKRDTVEAG
jgi:heterodisulfide reductase subunit A-like polyferredoxin